MPKSLWVRLAGCVGAILGALAYFKFSGEGATTVITADIFVGGLAAALVIYVLVHTLLEHYTVAKK